MLFGNRNSLTVIGICAGHTHAKALGFIVEKLQHVPAANYTNSDVPIHFLPAG
mgnify:FL=1